MMYNQLTCRLKYRASEIDDAEPIENVKEEIEGLFSTSNLYDIDYTGPIGTTGIHKHDLIDSPKILFGIARKLWRQAEDSLELDGSNCPLAETRAFVAELLNFTRTVLRNEHYASAAIRANLKLFRNSITHVTELEKDSALKLIAGTARQVDNPITQYFHLYLDCCWLLLTVGELEVGFLMRQLSYYSLKTYEKGRVFGACNCTRSVWLRLQLYCEHERVAFWPEFNAALELYDEEFLVNFIPFIAKLQCYDSAGLYTPRLNPRVAENLDFFNAKWAVFTKTTAHDLLKHLKPVEYLLCELWLEHVKLDFLYTTWDYFYKKLEAIEIDNNFAALLERIRNETIGDSGYLLFLKILRVQLRRHAGFWSKFRGRIYTRFSPAKFVKLNDRGMFNVALLMVVVSEVSFDEVAEKVLDMLQALPNDRKNTVVVWRIYFVLMELYVQAGKTIEPITVKLVPLINETSLNRNHHHLLALLPAQIDRLTSLGGDLKLGQETLFAQWLDNHTKTCPHSDLLHLLNALIIIVERVVANGVWYIYEKRLSEYLMPCLKRLAASCGVEMVGSLAGLIAASNSCDLQQTAAFFSSENVASAVISAFFTALSRNVDLPGEYDAVIVRAWFQCAVIGEAGADFTKYALSVSLVRDLNLGGCVKFEDFVEKLPADKECVRVCMDGLEKWCGKHLSAKTELIYHNIGLIFNAIGASLYSRSNASCPLSKFIDLLLLPMDVLRGIRPNNSVIKAVQKNWHLYLGTIYRISSGDPYLERIAKDIVVRYVPLFDEQSSPLREIAPDHDLTAFVLTKIHNEFFAQGSTRNEHTTKVLTIVKTLAENLHNLPQPKETVGLILPGLYEVYMFKNQKLPALDVLKAITQNELYARDDLTSAVRRSLVDLTKKHLPFNTAAYFQTLYVLVRIVPNEVKSALGVIKEEIRIVEAKRGQGFDNNLRISYDKLIKMSE